MKGNRKLIIDSTNCDLSDGRYILTNMGLNENNVKFKLDKIIIPYSFYSISNERSNNTVVLTSHPSGGPDTLTLTDGNYTIASLKTELETKLQAIDANFSVSYSSTKSKITITNSSGNFVINFDSSTANKILGFPSSGSSTAAASYTAPYTFSINDMDYIYLCSNILNHSYLNSKYSDVVCVIPITEGIDNNIIYIPNGHEIIMCYDGFNYNGIHFEFRDSDYKILTLNNDNWMMELEIINY